MTSPDLLHELATGLGDEYRVERELGGGGMSRVFVAEEKRLGRKVVVKVLNPDLAVGVSADRFEREIRLAAQLQDPRIVPLLTTGRVANLSYYTMPFVEGESLRARLLRGPVPVDEATSLLRDVAIALDYAHERGVVHRDIKPENVLLAHGTAVVTDFGIARAISVATGDGSTGGMTGTGTMIGTPAYMAPEQAAGDVVDHRADLYAWGVMAYELLSGVHPFASHKTAQSVIAAHLGERPAPLSQRAPALPASLAKLVDSTLEKDPATRPSSAKDLVRSIEFGTEVTLPRPARASRWLWAAAAVGALGIGVFAIVQRRSAATVTAVVESATPRSIAILPFVATNGDSSSVYFGDGMADELTIAFARVPGLRVASHGSATRLETARVSDSEIARQLNVETVLTGTVRRAGDRIRVSAQLINATDGSIMWADKYDRQLAQVFDVQDEMAHAIVMALRSTFTDTTQLAAVRAARGTDDLVAYDLYLKGRYYWTRRGGNGLRTAIDYFQRAIDRDSTFARAWAGLSMAQVIYPVFASVSGTDSIVAEAVKSAQHALRLDSTLADAHLALAYALKDQWQWKGSEAEFKKALALAPGDATIHHWYGVLLYVIGQTDSAVAQLRRAEELDPVAAQIGTDLYYALYVARHYDDALAVSRGVWLMDTTKADGALQIGMIELALGHPDSALTAFANSQRLGIGFDLRAFLSVANRRLGRTRVADSLYRAMVDQYRGDRSLAYAVAIAAAGAGDIEQGIRAIEETVDRRSVFVTEISLTCDPLFDPLRRDARFGRKLASVGLQVCPQ